MLVTTGNRFEGFEIIKYRGLVRGIVVRSTSIGAGIIGGLKSLAGGNISEFERVCERARADAYDKLIVHATEIGASGIIAMRYDATEFYAGVTEVLAYGTAVDLRKESGS